MKKNTRLLSEKEVIRTYLLESVLLAVVYLALVIAIGLLWNVIPALLIGIVLYLPYRICHGHLVRKHILRVLYRDLDPVRFGEIVSASKRFPLPVAYHITAALYSGDFRTALQLCKAQREKNASPQKQCEYLLVLAYIYFRVQDSEKLSHVCDLFDEYRQAVKNPGMLEERYPIMRYYRYYLEENYEACLALVTEMEIKASTDKNADHRHLATFNRMMLHAMAYKKQGEVENAKNFFEKIIETGPKMADASLAAAHLAALTGIADEPAVPSLDTDESDDSPVAALLQRSARASKTLRVIAAIGILLVVAGLALKAFLPARDPYAERLNKAFLQHYDSYTAVKNFPVTNEEGIIERLWVIDNNGETDLVGVAYSEETKEYTVIPYVKNIKPKGTYTINLKASQKTELRFTISDSLPLIQTRYYCVEEIILNGKSYWLLVTSINGVTK